jgi:alpha-tubulin suppressor-like RCC1 family protein
VAQPSGVAFSDLTAGEHFTCGRAATGQAYCWGDGSVGQLGDGAGVLRLTPVAVAHPQGIAFNSIGAGNLHTCATTSARTYCWGYNAVGALGDGTQGSRLTPVAVEY